MNLVNSTIPIQLTPVLQPGFFFTNISLDSNSASYENYITMPSTFQNTSQDIQPKIKSESFRVESIEPILNVSHSIKQEITDDDANFELKIIKVESQVVDSKETDINELEKIPISPKSCPTSTAGQKVLPLSLHNFNFNVRNIFSQTSSNNVSDEFNSELEELNSELEELKKLYVDNKCQICGFSSKRSRESSGWKHMRVHVKTHRFKCDVCERTFKECSALKNHMVIHENTSRFSCSACGKSFRRKNDLAAHNSTNHSDIVIAAFTCTVCSKAFVAKNQLKRHLLTHTGEKRFFCMFCDQGFVKKDCLESHVNKHNGVRPFKCQECGKDFHGRNYLKQHISMHVKGSIFECRECHLTFNFKSNLAQHLKIHSDKRNHKCTLCDKSFKLAHHLKQHLATHEPLDDEWADEPIIKEEISKSDMD